MDLSVIVFLLLLAAVAALRLVELRISRRHQQQLAARGAAKVDEPRFRWMVLLHTTVLIGAALEVIFLKRPFIPLLAAVMFAVFLAANAVRWWVIRTLGDHWNVQVMDSTRLGVVASPDSYRVDYRRGGLAGARCGTRPAPFHRRTRAVCESGISPCHGRQTQIFARLVLIRNRKCTFALACCC